MRVSPRVVLLCAVLGVGLGPEPVPVGAGPDEELGGGLIPEVGGDRPPDGCWPMPDGSSGRRGCTETSPPAAPLVAVWEHTPKSGTIAGEPLVWRDVVVVPYDDGFDVLRLSNGATIVSRRGVSKGTTADPRVGPGFVVVRTAPARLEAFAIDVAARTSKSVWSFASPDGPIADGGVICGRDLIVRSETTLWRLRVGRTDPVWKTVLYGTPLGSISASTYWVYLALKRVEEGTDQSYVGRFDSRTGTESRALWSGPLARSPAGRAEDAIVVAGAWFEAFAFAWFAPGLRAGDGSRMSTAIVRTDAPKDAPISLLRHRRAPVAFGSSWVFHTETASAGEELAITLGPTSAEGKADLAKSGAPILRYYPFADAEQGAHLLASPVPLTAAGTKILCGPHAFDARTRAIVHELPVEAAFRAVPARETLLLVESDGYGRGARLRAWRTRRPHFLGATVPYRAPVAGASPPTPHTVVLRDGSIRRGTIVPNEDATGFTLGKPARPPAAPAEEGFEFAQVALITAEGGAVVFAGEPDEAIDAMARIDAAERSKSLATLASEAGRASAFDVARAALDAAEACELPSADAWRISGELDAAERRAKGKKVSAATGDALRAKAKALQAASGARVWSWAARLPASASRVLLARLARRAWETEPDLAGPGDFVRANLPAGIEGGNSLAVREWIDWIEATQTTNVRILDLPPKGTPLSNSQRHLGAARVVWRNDVVAFESSRVVVLTPVDRPGRIARCLATAELVCRALESTFGEFRKKRAETDPLVVLLYGTKAEYLARSGGTFEVGLDLEHTLGHYDPGEGVSRLYLPDGDDEFRSVLETFVHELTHHWMDLCCPAFSDGQRAKAGASRHGYWVEEGFAQFVEEARFDLRAGLWDFDDPVAGSVDTIANAKPADLHPWGSFFRAGHREFARLDRANPVVSVPTRWRLGTRRRLTAANVYYDQAACAVRWLWFAEGGAHRAKLLEFVAAFHAGGAEADTLATSLGLTYEELGRRITAWAQARQRVPGR